LYEVKHLGLAIDYDLHAACFCKDQANHFSKSQTYGILRNKCGPFDVHVLLPSIKVFCLAQDASLLVKSIDMLNSLAK